ncbi:MAG: hypothetical protein AAB416_03135 [Patescibacteria group bacterium]
MSYLKSRIISLTLFTALGLGALQIPIAKLAGAKSFFTLFDLFAPTAGAFFGGIPGAFSVGIMQLAHMLIHGTLNDTASLIRLFPMMAAAVYFAKKNSLGIIVPLLAILVFTMHPIGRSVWYFSLFWTIPIICFFLRDRWLFARALGATFTAHAVGGALWIHAFSLPATVWISLIPVVIIERTVFAVGISLTYCVVMNCAALFTRTKSWRTALTLEPRYLLRKLRAGFDE